MNLKSEWKPFILIAGVFLLLFYLPVDSGRLENALLEAVYLARWYAREHVILCLIPAFFIAGAISVFISQASVIKYLGARANKVLAYGVASVSGSVLAVCSCTVLPLFGGIYKMGAGLGPATAFLYSGPAINVLAIVLTARILGAELGIARAIGAVLFSIVIGLVMHFTFRKEEMEKSNAQMNMPDPDISRPLWQNAIYFTSMIGILVFANWGKPGDPSGAWQTIYASKWMITSMFGIIFAFILIFWFKMSLWKITTGVAITGASGFYFNHEPMIPFTIGVICLTFITAKDTEESLNWLDSTWGFAKQITPLLFYGVLVAGLLLGRPGNEGLIPSAWISNLVGGNSFASNFFASVVGAFMYFATLTEVPILEGLIGNGMGKGPALALLLSGPALSLPNMLVIRTIMGTKKTVVFVVLVISMSTLSGILYGAIF